MKPIYLPLFVVLARCPQKASLLLAASLLLLCSPGTGHAQYTAKDSVRVVALLQRGNQYFDQEHLDSAAYFYQQAAAYSRKKEFSNGLVGALHAYNEVLNRKGAYQQALTNALEALEIRKKAGGDAEISIACNNVGNEYMYLGNMEKAAQYFMEALKLSETLGNLVFQRKYANNLAAVFLEIKETEKAYKYAYKSYQLAQQVGDTAAMASSLVNLAVCETLKKRYSKATEYFLKVIVLGKALQDPSYELDGYINLADVEVQQEKYQRALTYYQQALQVLHYYPAQDYELYVYWGLSECYLHLNMLKEATHYLQKGVAIAEKTNSVNELRQLYELGAEISEQLKDTPLALDYRKKFEALNDSLVSAETQQNIHRLEIEYQTSQKEKEIAEQRLVIANNDLEIEKKDKLIYLSVAVVIALFSGIFIIYMLYRSKQKANAEKLRALQKESEIKVLLAMIEGEEKERARLARELHDGVGGLLSATKMHLSVLQHELSTAAPANSFERTVHLLDGASREVRTIAHNLSPEILLNYRLDEALASFCRSVSSAVLQVDFYFLGEVPELKNNFKLLVYRMVQELVNNIIKHAGASHALVQLSHYDQLLSLTVEDNGAGFDVQTHSGIGLLNLQHRVADMNGQLTIDSVPGRGTTIYIELDISPFLEKDTAQLTVV